MQVGGYFDCKRFLFIYFLKGGLLFALLICSWCVRTSRARMLQSDLWKINGGLNLTCASRRASTLSSAVSSLSSTGMSFSRMDEKEKQQALEEEQARLQALKVTAFFFFYLRPTCCGKTPAGLLMNPRPHVCRSGNALHPLSLNMCESGGTQQCSGSIGLR